MEKLELDLHPALPATCTSEIFAQLFTNTWSQKDDGTFILRIEDTDQERLVEGAVDLIYTTTLKECGLEHDEGPDVGGDFGSYVQSERMASGIYKEYAEKLIELGGAHYCFCE